MRFHCSLTMRKPTILLPPVILESSSMPKPRISAVTVHENVCSRATDNEQLTRNIIVCVDHPSAANP